MTTKPRPSWPLGSDQGDPFDDRPDWHPATSYADWLRSPQADPSVNLEVYTSWVHQFLQADAEERAGRPAPQRAIWAERLALTGPLVSERRTRIPDPYPLGDLAHLARIAADNMPTVGLDAPDQILGPWAEVLRPEHDLVGVLALAALSELEAPLPCAFDQWRNSSVRPGREDRRQFEALAVLPQGVFQLTEVTADGAWFVQDHTDFHPRWLPPGPVQLRRPLHLAGPPEVGGWLCARLAPTPDGTVAACATVWPARAAAPPVARWVIREHQRCRLNRRSLRREPLLSRRGHVLARRLAEWAWSLA